MASEEFIIENQISEPKSAMGGFTLPCGLLMPDGTLYRDVEVREIQGNEEDMLASKKTPATKKMGSLLASCTKSIGPLITPEAVKMHVPNLLVGDRVFLLLAIRRVTLGDIYPFREKCPECEVKSLFDVDLSTLDLKEMKDPTVRSYDVVTPKGAKVRWHPMDGRGEDKLSQLQTEEDKVTLSLLVRLDLINDLPPSLAALKNMGMLERNFLRDCFQEQEGGVETSVDFNCSRCGHDFKADMDIGQQGFFFPSAARKGSKQKSDS